MSEVTPVPDVDRPEALASPTRGDPAWLVSFCLFFFSFFFFLCFLFVFFSFFLFSRPGFWVATSLEDIIAVGIWRRKHVLRYYGRKE